MNVVNRNKYDYLIIGLIASGASGILYSPITIQRLFIVLLLPYTLTHLKAVVRVTPLYIKLFFATWFLFSLFSMIWTPDRINGCKYMVYNFCSFIGFVSLVQLSLKANSPIQSIIWGWSILFLITLPIAINELLYGAHLDISVQDETARIINSQGERVFRTFASVTFGNLNTYTVVVVYCLSFLFIGLVVENKYILLFGVLLIASIYVLLMNSSRGGLLCLILSFIIFIFLLRKQRRSIRKWLFLFVLIAVIFVLKNADLLLDQISGRLLEANLANDSDRFELYKVVLIIFLDSLWLGAGVGGLQIMMDIVNNGGISAPHNMLLEMLGEYGIIPFITYIYMIYNILKDLIKSDHVTIRFLGWNITAIFLPLFIINSVYTADSLFWIFFASLFVIGFTSKKEFI